MSVWSANTEHSARNFRVAGDTPTKHSLISNRQSIYTQLVSLAGAVISQLIEGQKRYDVAIRLPESYRANPQTMQAITLRAPGGAQVTLAQVAQVRVVRAAIEIDREEGQRRMVVMSNVRGRDLGSFVKEVQANIARQVKLPAGYSIEYGGTV